MEAVLVAVVNRNFWAVIGLLILVGVLGVGMDLHQNGALGVSLVALAAVGGAFFVRPRRAKVAVLLVAAAMGAGAWSIRGGSIDNARDFDGDVNLMGGDTMARTKIVQEMGIAQVAGSKAESADRLDARTLAVFSDRYGKAMASTILANSTKGYGAFYEKACGLVFSVEHKLAGAPGVGPAVWEATRYLGADFYRVTVARPAWLDAIPPGKGPPAMEDAFKGCSERYSVARQKLMAR